MTRLILGGIGAALGVIVAVSVAGTALAVPFAVLVVAVAFGCDQLSPSRTDLTRFERQQEREQHRRAA